MNANGGSYLSVTGARRRRRRSCPGASTIEIGIVTGSFPSPTGLPSTNKFSVPGALALERPVLAGRGKLETQGIGDVPSGRHARRDAFAPRVRERAVQDIHVCARTRQRSRGEHQSRPWLVRRTRPAGSDGCSKCFGGCEPARGHRGHCGRERVRGGRLSGAGEGRQSIRTEQPATERTARNNGCRPGGRGRPRRCPAARRAAAATCQ